MEPLVAVVSADPRLVVALAGLPLTTVENAHPEQGISGSIAIGLRALPEATEAAFGQRVITAHADAVTEVPLPAGLGDDVDRPEEWPR